MLINEQIPEMDIRVISENGDQLGIMKTSVAMRLAEEADLDLAVIAPKAEPPVCKIMNYGKFRYEQIKHQKEAKKNQKVITLKEVRLSATIDTHDLEVKAKNATKFLADGDKVKVSIRFKGRQVTHTDQGLNVMNAFSALLDNAVIEKPAKMEGRNMFMILAPKNSK
ncbi:MAG: translation initiation factor IF-3 [Christensenellaceae bacterium]|nr:translation initiation factor IF-3 [Christensenellaceae bacterium]